MNRVKFRSFIKDEANERQLGKFFLIGQLTNNIELITITNIINNCSILRNTECKESRFTFLADIPNYMKTIKTFTITVKVMILSRYVPLPSRYHPVTVTVTALP